MHQSRSARQRVLLHAPGTSAKTHFEDEEGAGAEAVARQQLPDHGIVELLKLLLHVLQPQYVALDGRVVDEGVGAEAATQRGKECAQHVWT